MSCAGVGGVSAGGVREVEVNRLGDGTCAASSGVRATGKGGGGLVLAVEEAEVLGDLDVMVMCG